jgi:hypothetical protein
MTILFFCTLAPAAESYSVQLIRATKCINKSVHKGCNILHKEHYIHFLLVSQLLIEFYRKDYRQNLMKIT